MQDVRRARRIITPRTTPQRSEQVPFFGRTEREIPGTGKMTTDQLYGALDVLQVLTFGGLGAVALVQWRRRGGRAAGWLAVTFGSLAVVVLLGEALPEEPESLPAVALQRVLIAVAVLFPYLLYQFGRTFFDPIPWFYRLATALTVLAVAGALIIEIPEEGEPRSVAFQVFIYLVLVQWTLISARVATALWRAGEGQPTVARRRLRVMALGSLALVLALVIAGLAEPSEDPGPTQIIVELFAIGSGPLFLLGFAPPAFVRIAWRHREQAGLRDAELRLLQAETEDDVAAALLPHVTHLVAGEGSALIRRDGTIIGVHGLDEDPAVELVREVEDREPTSSSYPAVSIPLESGTLAVRTSRYTPFFGDEELGIMGGLAVVADLALARADLLERERRTAAELQAANEAMRDFVAIASHDLRTPITVIQGFCIALEQQWAKIGDSERSEYLTIMRRQSEHLTRLVDDLLMVSRIDAKALDTQKETLEVRKAIELALEGMEAEIEIDADPALTVYADPHHINRILRNYVGNAISHGEPPVRIEATGSSEWVELRVRDYGEGIAGEFVTSLFEKFARAGTRNTDGRQGTGLGLSIVRGLAEANGGEAWYEPNEPRGSCFAIRLPQIDM
jgi:signal transduction histidine kinase